MGRTFSEADKMAEMYAENENVFFMIIQLKNEYEREYMLVYVHTMDWLIHQINHYAYCYQPHFL